MWKDLKVSITIRTDCRSSWLFRLVIEAEQILRRQGTTLQFTIAISPQRFSDAHQKLAMASDVAPVIDDPRQTGSSLPRNFRLKEVEVKARLEDDFLQANSLLLNSRSRKLLSLRLSVNKWAGIGPTATNSRISQFNQPTSPLDTLHSNKKRERIAQDWELRPNWREQVEVLLRLSIMH